MKTARVILRFLLGILLLMPVLGSFGIFPPPTEEMYSTAAGWTFMETLMNSGYMMPLIGLTCAAVAILCFLNQAALAAIILTPFTVNVICFHLFLDASPVSAAAIPAYILVALNAFLLWDNRATYKALWSA